jgi:hypothetical protein
MESFIWEAQAAMLAIRLAIQHMKLAPYLLGNSLLTVLAINKLKVICSMTGRVLLLFSISIRSFLFSQNGLLSRF